MDDAVADLQEYIDAGVKEFREKHPEFTLLQTRRYAIAGKDAYEIVALMETGGIKIGYVGTYILNGTELYFVTCMAEDGGQGHFLKYLGVFQEIVGSVNFKG